MTTRITASIVVGLVADANGNLTDAGRSAALASVMGLPAGATVRLVIGSCLWTDYHFVHALAYEIGRVDGRVHVEGSNAAVVQRWCEALAEVVS